MPGVTIGHPAVFYKQKEHHGRRERELEQIQTLYERYKNNVDRLQPGKEQSWLLTVTANECRNLLRQRSHMSQEAMPEPSSEIPEETGLLDALLQLQPQYRAVVHLFYFEGYTTREIGRLLGIKQSCVTTRLSRARAILKTKLEEDVI